MESMSPGLWSRFKSRLTPKPVAIPDVRELAREIAAEMLRLQIERHEKVTGELMATAVSAGQLLAAGARSPQPSEPPPVRKPVARTAETLGTGSVPPAPPMRWPEVKAKADRWHAPSAPVKPEKPSRRKRGTGGRTRIAVAKPKAQKRKAA